MNKEKKSMSKKMKIIMVLIVAFVLLGSTSGAVFYANQINDKVTQTQVAYHSLTISDTEQYNAVELAEFNTLQEQKQKAFDTLDVEILNLLQAKFDTLNKQVEQRLYKEFLEEKEEEYILYLSVNSEMTQEEQITHGNLSNEYSTFVVQPFTITLEEQKEVVIKMLDNIKKKSEEITQAIANRKAEAESQSQSQSNVGESTGGYDYDDSYDYDYDDSYSGGGSGNTDGGSQGGESGDGNTCIGSFCAGEGAGTPTAGGGETGAWR